MSLVKYHNNSNKALNHFFDNFFNRNLTDVVGTDFSYTQAATNVVETDEAYRLEVVAPGLECENFNIQLEENQLSISAKRKAQKMEEGTTYKRREFNFTSFKRSFELPETVDVTAITANYEDGILMVQLPKKESAKPIPPRQIDVN